MISRSSEENLVKFFYLLGQNTNNQLQELSLNPSYHFISQLGFILQECLVGLLTLREKRAARILYDHFDVDKDGVIDAIEARMAFRAWYTFTDNLTAKHR